MTQRQLGGLIIFLSSLLAFFSEPIDVGPVDPDVDPIVDPDVDPSPITEGGKRALIVYESSEKSKLPFDQQIALDSGTLREWLGEHTDKGPDGAPEFRVWDQDVDLSFVSDVWREAMTLERESLPWLIVSNGKTGYSGPLPGTEDEILAVLRRYLE